jgi:SAM-dependent methyltransferase
MILVSNNQLVFDREQQSYRGKRELLPPEQVLLTLLRGRWDEIDMLDLGIGAGRTTYTFAPITKSYVGIDFAAQLLNLAKELAPVRAGVELRVGDARDLSSCADSSFDVVLFSFNGIDYSDHSGRLTILREARRVLREDGWFVMCSHSLAYLPFPISLSWPASRNPMTIAASLVRQVRLALRFRTLNRSIDLDAVRRRGWAIVRDGAHHFSLDTYYVEPRAQVEQLGGAGFEVHKVLDASGSEVSVERPGTDPWLTYFCRPSRGSAN